MEKTPISAGFWRRLAAMVYDSLIVIALLFFGTAIVMIVHRGNIEPQSLLFRLYLCLIIVCFFVWFWVHGGQTIGMRTWKIRVQRLDGTNLNWVLALSRLLLAWMTLGLGLLWVIIDSEHQSIYDRWTKTQVIKT